MKALIIRIKKMKSLASIIRYMLNIGFLNTVGLGLAISTMRIPWVIILISWEKKLISSLKEALQMDFQV